MDYLKKGVRVHALLKVHAHIADYKKKPEVCMLDL